MLPLNCIGSFAVLLIPYSNMNEVNIRRVATQRNALTLHHHVNATAIINQRLWRHGLSVWGGDNNTPRVTNMYETTSTIGFVTFYFCL